MYSYQTGYWPQSDPYLVSFKKPAHHPVSPSAKTDMQIAHDVKDELKTEPTVRASAIDVQVNGGMVTLSGVVDSDGERWLIESAARRTAGVKDVATQLKVFAAGVTPADDDIAHDCERVLEGLLPASDYAIGVMVSHGWVTLSGYVAEGYERRIAETEVSSLLSVHGVNSQVRVRPLLAKNGADADVAASSHLQDTLKPGSDVESDDDGMTWSRMRTAWAEHQMMLHTTWSASGAKRVMDRMRP